MHQKGYFRFTSHEWALFERVLNEVVHGFFVPDFEATIGNPAESAKLLLCQIQALRKSEELSLSGSDARAVRNALRETLRELGIGEFHTRTGYEFDQAKTILTKLDGLLSP